MERDEIYHRYGWQFTAGRKIDSNVPDEWLPAIAALCAGVDELIQDEQHEDFHWLDIKEKRGQLAVDYAQPEALTDAIDALVEAAESACHTVEPFAPTKSEKRFLLHDTREQSDDASANQDDATLLTDALQSHARLIVVNALDWQGQTIPVWLPVGNDGKALCGAILYLEDMPLALCNTFKDWLAQQVLSISRPPLGLPRKGQAYLLEDVLMAIESSD